MKTLLSTTAIATLLMANTAWADDPETKAAGEEPQETKAVQNDEPKTTEELNEAMLEAAEQDDDAAREETAEEQSLADKNIKPQPETVTGYEAPKDNADKPYVKASSDGAYSTEQTRDDVKANQQAELEPRQPVEAEQLRNSETSAVDNRDAYDSSVFVETRYLSMKPETLNANRVLGADIYSAADEEIAEIEDVIVDANGRATNAIIRAGGFFGLGKDTYSVSFDQLTLQPTDDGDEFRVTTKLTDEEIKKLERWKEKDFVIGEEGQTLLSEINDAELQVAGTERTLDVTDVMMTKDGDIRSVIVAYDGEERPLSYRQIEVSEGDAAEMGYSVDISDADLATWPTYRLNRYGDDVALDADD